MFSIHTIRFVVNEAGVAKVLRIFVPGYEIMSKYRKAKRGFWSKKYRQKPHENGILAIFKGKILGRRNRDRTCDLRLVRPTVYQ